MVTIHLLHSAICLPNADMPQILILIFAEVLGLYGLIVALILNTNSAVDYTCPAPQ